MLCKLLYRCFFTRSIFCWSFLFCFFFLKVGGCFFFWSFCHLLRGVMGRWRGSWINDTIRYIFMVRMSGKGTVIKISLLIVIWTNTIFFISLFITRQRLRYENGKYFDPHTDTVIKEQSLIVIFILTLFFFLISSFYTYTFIKGIKK